ncbi:hypothetical protein NG799_29060 [Laspinema sp. D1]|uniref:Uncharacterized protein n=1 Tax=Laspinema palackyanum D2a TaxID=2953684 RepID=A0ABT2N0D1_9CYAN|nr:hypothetical protein [Laspinema sp. D2a]
MDYLRTLGATNPKFSLGDRIIATSNDPDAGVTHTLEATISGMVWDDDRWDYALKFDGYRGADFGWGEHELIPLDVYAAIVA